MKYLVLISIFVASNLYAVCTTENGKCDSAAECKSNFGSEAIYSEANKTCAKKSTQDQNKNCELAVDSNRSTEPTSSGTTTSQTPTSTGVTK